jgi:hypothetical protein
MAAPTVFCATSKLKLEAVTSEPSDDCALVVSAI